MSNQYIGNDPLELIKHLAEAQANRKSFCARGLITSVDQTTYTVKVMLQPWGIETGWIPLGTMAAGPGWGFFHVPPDGTEVLVDFVDGSVDNGVVRCCFSNETDAPPSGLVQGEFLLRHSSGSLIHFDKDGNVTLTTAKDLTVTAQGNLSATVQGNLSADVQGSASLTGSGSVSISGGSVSIGSDTTIDGVNFLSHSHSGVQNGPGVTGPVE